MFYMMQIRQSVVNTFEQLRVVEMELEILKHQATLSPEQIERNVQRSKKPEPGSMPPMQVKTITVSIIEPKSNQCLCYRKNH